MDTRGCGCCGVPSDPPAAGSVTCSEFRLRTSRAFPPARGSCLAKGDGPHTEGLVTEGGQVPIPLSATSPQGGGPSTPYSTGQVGVAICSLLSLPPWLPCRPGSRSSVNKLPACVSPSRSPFRRAQTKTHP